MLTNLKKLAFSPWTTMLVCKTAVGTAGSVNKVIIFLFEISDPWLLNFPWGEKGDD